jgi:hypothetical protein
LAAGRLPVFPAGLAAFAGRFFAGGLAVDFLDAAAEAALEGFSIDFFCVFFCVFLDIRLPFVAFDGSIMGLLQAVS